MPGKALFVSIPSIAAAAFALYWLAPPRSFEAAAEPSDGAFSVSTQIFDATLIGGERHSFVPAANESSRDSAAPAIKAQIFDPEVFGTVRSNFSGTRSVAGNPEARQSTREGRSVATPVQAAPAPAPARETSPVQPRECEPRPSARTNEPQFGSLARSDAVG
jgi:hypothetical protein